jgi:hypothetical protein
LFFLWCFFLVVFFGGVFGGKEGERGRGIARACALGETRRPPPATSERARARFYFRRGDFRRGERRVPSARARARANKHKTHLLEHVLGAAREQHRVAVRRVVVRGGGGGGVLAAAALDGRAKAVQRRAVHPVVLRARGRLRFHRFDVLDARHLL